MGCRVHTFLSNPSNSQIFIPSNLRGIRRYEMKFNEFFYCNSHSTLISSAACPHTRPAYWISSLGSKTNNQAWVSTRNQANQLKLTTHKVWPKQAKQPQNHGILAIHIAPSLVERLVGTWARTLHLAKFKMGFNHSATNWPVCTLLFLCLQMWYTGSLSTLTKKLFPSQKPSPPFDNLISHPHSQAICCLSHSYQSCFHTLWENEFMSNQKTSDPCIPFLLLQKP